MSTIPIAGRKVSVRDIATRGVALAWERAGSDPRPAIGRDLRFGDHGPDVVALRDRLYRAGIRSVVLGGVLFDRVLEEQVIEYQARHRLRADGRVGPVTRESLSRAAH